MATPINAPMAGEIWHLSIEDLFQPVQEAPRLGGEGPFVINLSVSTAPISVPTKALTNSRLDAHVYQIQVTEDGRTRYRLRLGPFASEDEADAILAEVRDTYPGALTATASAADLRVISTMQAKAETKPAAPKLADLVIEKAVSQKIAKEKVAAESGVSLKVDVPEISIDIAWPTPELGVPPISPQRAASAPAATLPTATLPSATLPSAIESEPPAVPAPAALKPQWALPELDVPLPAVQKQPAAAAGPVVAREPVAPASAPAPEAFELKLAPPYSIDSVAPVLTEVVAPSKTPAPRIKALPHSAAPPTAGALPHSAAPPPTAAAPAVIAAAPVPAKAPAQQETVKPAPVLTQSIAPARRSWPRFRAALTKPVASKLTSLQHVVVATAPAPAPREVKKLDEPLESLESTQTIRALTPMELEDNEVSRWFVIQLALADHAFDPDAVPNLDIFSEYRLYSVAGLDQGRVVHALRLGFFREEIGAVAVASYLAAYWDKPTIRRVSLAERERFANQRVEARKDVGATGKHAVIEITDELVARRRRSTKSAAIKSADRPVEH
jgi:hypothetical protein